MDAVFYPSLVPNNRYTITQLGLIFERIVLPGVYLPLQKLDPEEIKARIHEIEKVDAERGENSGELLMPLYFALHYRDLHEVFVGTGEWGHMGMLEPEASELTKEIESLYFGPPKPGFTPIPSMGFNFGVGSENDVTKQINGPATFSYPANAYVYASKHGLPLITDSNKMPLPMNRFRPATAEIITAQLSLASLGLILPRVKPLNAAQIMEVRTKMREDIQALNATLSGYAGKIRDMVGNNPDLPALQAEADFIAKTEIFPQIEHLRRTLESPGRILQRNALDLAIENPELFARIALQPHDLGAWIAALNATGNQLSKAIHEIREGAAIAQDSGLNLLLKLPKKYRA